MADAGFFRGTSSDQDGRFSDKEKKLLKQMKFEAALEKKINMGKVNLDVIKPWITVKINEILGVEDDVLIEYIISQLETSEPNPKVMQINITGFLNARFARLFMGELWALLIEAYESSDGIPPSLVQKKANEMKKENEANGTTTPAIKTLAQNDWANRYQNLSLGRFSGTTKEKEVRDDRIVPRNMRSPDRKKSPRQARDRSPRQGQSRDRRSPFANRRSKSGRRGDRWEENRKERQTSKEREIESKRREEERLKRRAAERERDRKREEERDNRRQEHRRRRSRTRSRSPARRRFTEDSIDRKKKRRDSSVSESEGESKKEKRRERKREASSGEDDRREKDKKEKKKHKKEKKKKERKRSPTPSSSTDSD